jgi:NTE family protein
MSNKTAFVLSGGGAKGAFQVGVMKALAEQGVVPDVAYGTSVGALNITGYSYVGLEELAKIWRRIKRGRDMLGLNLGRLVTLSATGVFNTKPLRKKIRKIVRGHDADFPAWVCVTNLSDGSISYHRSESPDFPRMVEASAAIPVAMDPIRKYLVDGGVREQAPLKRAIKDGADKIVLILCNPMQDKMKHWGYDDGFLPMIGIGLRAVQMLQHEVYINDINTCQSINREIARYTLENASHNKKLIDLKVYAPDHTIIGTLDFNPRKISKAIQQGYDIVAK